MKWITVLGVFGVAGVLSGAGLPANAATASVNGANIPTLTSITDSASNVWTVVSGVVYENGTPAAKSSGVIKLFYYNGVIYQQNSAKLIWSWNGTTWVGPIADPRVVSANKASIPTVSSLIDSSLNIWALVGGVVYENGKLAGYTSGVNLLGYNNGLIYQENLASDVWTWNGTAWVASPINGVVTALDMKSIQNRNAACLPFGVQTFANNEKSAHKVFAHYMLNFQMVQTPRVFQDPLDYFTNNFLNPIGESNDHLFCGGYLRSRPLPVAVVPDALTNAAAQLTNSINNYENEVRLALSIGIDGFTTDIMDVGQLPTLANLLTAIQNVNTTTGAHFVVFPLIDAYALKQSDPTNYQADIITILETVRTNPNMMRLPTTGNLVFGSFQAENFTVAVWSAVLAQLQKDENGLKPAFVPIFASLGSYNAANSVTPSFDSISYMISTWGDRTPKENAAYEPIPATFHAKNLGFMMPVAPQDFRPKDTWYDESVNSLAYRTAWTSAIKGGADWVQLVTWNDYSEHTHVMPSFGTQYGFYDLAAYYTSLFKGYPTYVGKDSVYLFYRNQISGAGAPTPNPVLQSSDIILNPNGGSDNGPSDLVEAVVFTDSNDFKTGYNPVVNITVGGTTTSFKIPQAGMTTFTVPITFPTTGTTASVSASIVVNGVTNVSLTAPVPIQKTIQVQNFLYQSASATAGSAVACGFPEEAAYQSVWNTMYQSVYNMLAPAGSAN